MALLNGAAVLVEKVGNKDTATPIVFPLVGNSRPTVKPQL